MNRYRHITIYVCLILLLATCFAGCTGSLSKDNKTTTKEIRFTDALGNQIVLPKTAERIALQNFYAAEILIAIGEKDRIVAISNTLNVSDYKRFVPNAINYGDWTEPDLEKLIEAKPDVLICHASSVPRNADKIAAANITIICMDCKSLDSIASDIRTLGLITGNTEKAEELASFQEKYINMVKERTSGLNEGSKPTVYYESTTPYNANGKNSSGDKIISLAGGKNIAGNEFENNKKVNAEWVISREPYVIIRVGVSNTTTLVEHQKIMDEIKSRTGFNSIKAIKENRTYTIGSVIITGPRTVIGLLYVAKALHPDLFKDVDPAAVNKEYADKYLPGADRGVFFYPELK